MKVKKTMPFDKINHLEKKMSSFIHMGLVFFILIHSISSEWITISDYSVTTWNQTNADRPKTLTTFKTTNYPSKYIRPLTNRIDTYTYDDNN